MNLAEKLKEYMGYYDTEASQEPEDAPATPAADQATVPSEIVLIKPERFQDAPAIVDHLNRNHTIVLNLEALNKDLSRHLMDFLGGAAYAKNARIERIASTTYLITPYNVDFMCSQPESFEEDGSTLL